MMPSATGIPQPAHGNDPSGPPAAVVLSTKLLIPRVRTGLVRRDRLTAALTAGMQSPLALLCAPAGFGKTTLLVDTLRSRASDTASAPAVAWCSLDESDNDPVQFLWLIVAALRPIVARIGETAVAMIQHPVAHPLRAALATLIPELDAAREEIILVLEDYHVIQSQPVHEALEFLLTHLPEQVHVVIATREDPPFRLLLRSRGLVFELLAADLRMTAEETGRFFRDVMRLEVSGEEVAALEGHTEGWVAGLQLAALSVRERGVSSFLARHGADDRYLLDYLGAEILALQSRAVQVFLLRTSVLQELSAPLCEAVMGSEPTEGGAQAMLEHIEQANLFLVPLDAERRWYRYHQLFAHFLQLRVAQVAPGLTAELHRRAAAWYEAQGHVHEAIRHALAGCHFEHAGRLIERQPLSLPLQGQLQTLLGWYRVLPTGTLQASPRLGVGYAFALCLANQVEAAESHLHAAEDHLAPDMPPEELGFVRAGIALVRTIIATTAGDLTCQPNVVKQALDLLPVGDVAGRTWARQFAVWLEFRVSGSASTSEHPMSAAIEELKMAGLPVAARIALAHLAWIYISQGRLSRAAAALREIPHVLGMSVATSLAVYYFFLGDLLREQNDFDGAERLLAQGMQVVTDTNIVGSYSATVGYIALARLRQARGEATGAMSALDDFVTLARRRQFATAVLAHAAAARAHLWLLQGNLTAAARWADRSGIGPHDAPSFPREAEYCVLARVLIAKKDRAVVELLQRLLGEAEARGRMGSAIEILGLRAVALRAFHDTPAAMASLERALTLAEPERYVRVFVDEGAPMLTLLRRARSQGIAPEYTAILLRAFQQPASAIPPGPEGSSPSWSVSVRPDAEEPLLEPLSPREREIVRLLVSGASNQAIARRLFITEGTVKTHVQHIFGKLGVKNRTQAVIKAQALHLD